MKNPFDCDCCVGEILTPVLGASRLFLLNTEPVEALQVSYPIYACPVCQDEKKEAEESGAIVLDLFENNHDEVILLLRHSRQVAVWVLRPDGAKRVTENSFLEPIDLVSELRGHAQHLEPTLPSSLPQTDQPVLYMGALGLPCLRFTDNTFALWSDGMATLAYGESIQRSSAAKVDLVALLYEAATAEPPDEKPSAIVLDLFLDQYDNVRLQLGGKDIPWTLEPNGAYVPVEHGRQRCYLVQALRERARHLEPMWDDDLPQTDQPVLYKNMANEFCLRFNGNSYALWESDQACLMGAEVDLVALLYEAATDDPPDEKPGHTHYAERLRAQVAGLLTLATIFRPIRVVWNDATPYHGWHNLGDGDRLPLETMETMGYLVGETPAAIVVARAVSEHKARDLLVIPRTAIVKMEFMDGIPGHGTMHG